MKAGVPTQGGPSSHNLPGNKYKCIVFLKINGIVTQCLVDTGATASAVSMSFVQCFPSYKKLIRRRSCRICVAVNGQNVKSLFSICLPVLLDNNKVIYQDFEVIDSLIHPVLLGTNFLKAQEARLDFGTDSIQIGTCKIPFQIAEWVPSKPAHLVSAVDIIIEPFSISLLKAELAGIDPRLRDDKPTTLLIGPLGGGNNFDCSLIVSHSVIDPYLDEIWIECLNPFSVPMHLTVDSPVAIVEEENPVMRDTGVNRDLNLMPSQLAREETEDYCEGMENMFSEKDKTSVRGNVSKVASSVNRSEAPSTHYTAAFSDEVPPDPPLNEKVEKNPAPRRAERISAYEGVGGKTKSGNAAFTPKGMLTREGVKYFKNDTFANIDPSKTNAEGINKANETVNKNETVRTEDRDETDKTKTNETDKADKVNVGVNDPKYKLTVEKSVFSDEEKIEFESIVENYPGVVAAHADDIGETTLAYHYANLTSDIPVRANYYRAPPPKVREELDRETDRLLAAGIIRESNSPYCAPIVLVKKPDGSWRYCTDFRKLNRITE